MQKNSYSQSKKRSHPNELSENRRKGDVRWGEKSEKEGWLVKLVGDLSSGLEAPSRSQISERGGSKEDVREGETAREAMEKSKYVRAIGGKGVREDDSIEYFLPTGFGSTF